MIVDGSLTDEEAHTFLKSKYENMHNHWVTYLTSEIDWNPIQILSTTLVSINPQVSYLQARNYLKEILNERQN
jgi:hypothetical protein